MNNLRFIINTLLLIVLQVLVFNNIQINSYVYVNVYVLSLVLIPHLKRSPWVLFYAFALGLLIDFSQNTMGINAAAMTLMAFLCPRLLELVASRQELENIANNANKQDDHLFVKYLSVVTLLFNIALIFEETFSFSNFGITLLRIVASSVVSFLFMISYYYIAIKQRS